MKLLFVMNSAKYFVLNRLPLAKAAQEQGYTVYAAVCFDDLDSVRLLESAGVTCLPFQLKRTGLNPLPAISSALQLKQILRKIKPNVVHSLTIKSIILAGILCRWYKIPFVALIAGRGIAFTSCGLKGWWMKKLGTWLYRAVFQGDHCAICFQNPDDLEYFKKEKISLNANNHLIGTGVNIHRFHYQPYDLTKGTHRTILMAARMLKSKGVREFTGACEIVKQLFPRTDFILVGAPDPGNPDSFETDELVALCSETGTRWLGYSTDMVETLAKCDIFCLPTYYPEGIPMTLLQAGSMGKPLIVSDMPGCRQIVEHGKTGLIVPPKDDIALAAAIVQLLESPDICYSIAFNVRDKIEDTFHEEAHHGRFLSLYQRIQKRNSDTNCNIKTS